MRLLRKLAATSAAAVMVMAGGSMVAQADETPTVYNTPGGQIENGRLWNTTCEKYSTNVVRCRTEIWATTVTYVKGRYVQKTGWTFNNLSYLPSPRASWVGNNLGTSNPGWTSDGRQWRTECDTAATGRGGCRSYMLVNVVKKGSGGYVNAQEWVFNNLVLFSSPTLPPVTKVPAHILDQSRLSFTGVGPIQLGASMKDLKTLGYMKYPGDVCEDYGETTVLMDRGIDTFNDRTSVTDVIVYKNTIKTVEGAHVGMTFSEVKAIYGDRMTKVTKKDAMGGDVPTAVVQMGGRELVFTADELRPLTDSEPINSIVARKVSNGYFYDGC